MGGFYNTIAKLATEGVEKIGAKVANSQWGHEAAESVERGIYHGVFPAKTAFQDIPVANQLYQEYAGPYKETVNKLTSQGVQAAQRAGTNQPAHEISRAAERQAQDIHFGQNLVAIQGVLKHVEKTVSKNRADILADHLNIMFKEAPDPEGLSKFDRDMRKGADENKFQTPPSEYRGKTPVELIANKHQALLAYKAAIPHLSSNLNILISDGFKTYAKVLATEFSGTGRKAAEAQLLASNAISEVWEQGYKEKLAFDNGKIKQFLPNSVGEFIHKNMFIPGMSRVRYETLLMSANASKFAAQEAAQHLVQGNDRMALPTLRELGLDPVKIRAQQGLLLADDIQKAYYHGTNVRAFLNPGENRTVLSQRSPLFRTTAAFHSYITNQSKFFRQVFKRQYEQGDFIGIARNIGLMSTVFPVVGASIYETERLLTGNDWDNPAGHFGEKLEMTPAGGIYDAINGRQNANSKAKQALGMIEGLSHVASFGVVTGYVRGASRRHLANQLLGPDINQVVQGAEDLYGAAQTSNTKPKAWKPLARDITSAIPMVGGPITHELLPTTKEDAAKKPKKFRRARPKPESWNPLN